MAETHDKIFEFDSIRVEPVKFKAWRGGEELVLEPKTLSVLIFLLENRGRLIEKEELLNAIWQDTFVTENAMAREIAKLRKALGDDAKEAKYIQTVHTKGYRFVAEVTAAELDGNGSSTTFRDDGKPYNARPQTPIRTVLYIALGIIFAVIVISSIAYRRLSTGPSVDQISTIAVIPLINESGDAEMDYLSDGMTEALITNLSQIPHLNMKARNSIFRYKGRDSEVKKMASELDVKAVLLGRINQRSQGVILRLELLDAKSEEVIWSQKYERSSADLPLLHGIIARDVGIRLRSRLSSVDETKISRTYTSNLDAYEHYLRGRFHLTKRTEENIKKAILEFEAAKELDPAYPLAYVGLADAYWLLGPYGKISSTDSLPIAMGFAQRAIEIDDTVGAAHASLAVIYDNLWRWDEAGKEYERAIELDPNYGNVHLRYASYLQKMGQLEQSFAEIERAHDLDPVTYMMLLGEVSSVKGEHDLAIERFKKTIELDPGNWHAYSQLGMSFIDSGRGDEAIIELQTAVNLSARSNIALGNLGYGYAKTGDSEKALGIKKELEDRYQKRETPGFYLAGICAALGDKDGAFEWLEKDFQERSGELPRIRSSRKHATLRNDPRFNNLLQRIGLPALDNAY